MYVSIIGPGHHARRAARRRTYIYPLGIMVAARRAYWIALNATAEWI